MKGRDLAVHLRGLLEDSRADLRSGWSEMVDLKGVCGGRGQSEGAPCVPWPPAP